jgi:asparagine synthase (glutamine-hydrolysing)
MLMANSVEGRFPFLDHRVMEFAAGLDPRLKMRVLNEKHLLKRAMRRDLPSPILERHKQPYRAPDSPSLFSGRDLPWIDELLGERKLRDYGYFDANRVELLVAKARSGRATAFRDNMALVGILTTQLWHYHFVERFCDWRPEN